MADQGDVIVNPVTGERVIFRKTARDTNAELLQFELFMKPHGVRIFEHVHPKQEERITLVSGTVRYRLGGTEHNLGPGQPVTLPPGIPHTLWNAGDDEAVVMIEARPALKTETAIETLFGLARDGKTNDKGMLNPLHSALVGREYETFFPFPPVPVQRAAMAAVAPIARLLGYRARYTEYSGPES